MTSQTKIAQPRCLFCGIDLPTAQTPQHQRKFCSRDHKSLHWKQENPDRHKLLARRSKRLTSRKITGFEDSPGYIYGVTHPSFPGYIKIGRTINSPEDRLKQYKTGCPLGLYEFAFVYEVSKCAHVETEVQDILFPLHAGGYSREWFKASPPEALEAVAEVMTRVW